MGMGELSPCAMGMEELFPCTAGMREFSPCVVGKGGLSLGSLEFEEMRRTWEIWSSLSMGKVRLTEDGIDSTTFSTNGWSGMDSWDLRLERVGLTKHGF